MDFLAEQLGISKRTIYLVFKDKDDLVNQCIRQGIQDHESMIREIIHQSSNVLEAIHHISVVGKEMSFKTNPLFYLDLKKYHPKIYDGVFRKGDLIDSSITYTLLERGIKEGVFDQNLNIDIIHLFWQRLPFLLNDLDSFPSAPYEKPELFENIMFPFIRGLCTEKGLKLFDQIFVKTSVES